MLYPVRNGFVLLLLVLMFAQVSAEDAVPVTGGHVARAAFTTRIVNREPVDRVLVLNPPATEIYFFTDLRNLEGRTVTHRWEYQGKAVSNVPFVVKGNRWRVFSRKVFPTDSYGEWSVTVVDDNGWPLYVELFRYESIDIEAERRQQTGHSEESPGPAGNAPATAGLPSSE
jgi:hypothetical protein